MLTPMAVLLLEVRLNEMAKMITDDESFVSKLTTRHDINSSFFSSWGGLPIIHDMGYGVKLHGTVTGNGGAYFGTIDHQNKRMVHVTKVTMFKADSTFPHDRIEQELVDKDSNHPIGSRPGYARSFAYSHWMSQHLPFRSSPDQAIGGHKMWLKYSKSALDAGKHVYYHSPETGFVKLNNNNLEEYHNRYFGKTDEHRTKSLVLSHTPFDVSN
jgi:hypothetical protein